MVYASRPFHSVILFLLLLATIVTAQAPERNGRGKDSLLPVDPGDREFRKRERERCRDEFRTMDGTCTNKRQKLWGSAARPHYAYNPSASSDIPTGQDLPSARYISNVLCKQDYDTPNRRGLTEFLVFFGQFLDHNLVATPTDTSQPMPIPIPLEDPAFGNFTAGELPFHRSELGLVAEGFTVVRPINVVTSAIDLSAVYGSDDLRARTLRAMTGGKLLTSAGDNLPHNTAGMFNAPTNDPSFFLAGDHRANEHPVLTSLHTVFMREHNRLCDELFALFPTWDDERLYQMARKINGAQFQKIVYEQFYPAMTGRLLRRYRRHGKRVDPTVSDVFSTAAFRVGHTMVGNHINRRGPGMVEMPDISMHEMFFRPVEVMSEGVEPFIRGAIFNVAQEVDLKVVNALRDFLFTNVPHEAGLDLVALNLQRGRDHALPTYNEIRRLFRLRPAYSFADITWNVNVQSALATAYGTADRVEAWVGLVAEDHMRGASMGRTMFKIWKKEFKRLRDGDRFFYEQPRLFPREVWALPRLREIYSEYDTMKSILLRNTNVAESDLPGDMFVQY